MTTLTVRGYVYRINMSTDGDGIYNVASYEMGRPEHEIENDPMSKATCTDTITLNIVSKSRTELVRSITRLYKTFTEAVSFYNRLTDIPCYLESLTSGQIKPVWAGIKSFSFHELNDPYDLVNGRIVQDATLIIVRDPWSNVPPQNEPFILVDPVGVSIAADRIIPITFDEPLGGASYAYRPVLANGTEEFLFISNFWRKVPVNAIYSVSTSSTNMQPATYTVPYAFGNILNTTTYRFTIGIKDEVASPTRMGYFNALVWNAGLALNKSINSDVNGVIYQAYTSGSWLNFRPMPDYILFDRIGLSYAGVGRSTRQTLENGAVGSFLKFTITTASGLNVGALQSEYKVYAPGRPYIDILTPPGGDMPTKLQFKIASMETVTPLDLDMSYGTELLYDPYKMNSLIIASQRILNTNDPLHPGVGVYTLGYDVSTDDTLYGNDHAAGQLYAFHSTEQSVPNVYVIKADATAMSESIYYSFASKYIDLAPGLYRAFVRYFVPAGSASPGYYYMRLAATNAQPESWFSTYGQQYIETGHRTTSRSFGIDLQNTLGLGVECLADLGSIQLGSASLRNPGATVESSVRVFIELKKSLEAAGSIYLVDLILLPMNYSFIVAGGSRSPLSRFGYRPDRPPRETPSINSYVSEFLYMTEFQPGGAIASVAMTFPEGVTYETRVTEDYFISGGNRLVTEPDYGRRFYFLWYKKMPGGIIYSYSQHNSAVQVMGAKQFIALPAST